MSRPSALLGVAVLLVTALAACGSDGDQDPVEAVAPSVRAEVAAAQEVRPDAFPAPSPNDRLEDFAARFDTATGVQAVAASSVFTPPRSRLAFGLITGNQQFAYGDTVVYLQRRSGGPITGPIAAPADVLVTEKRYRSEQAASEKDPFAAVYEAELPLPRTGIYNVLVVSQREDGVKIAAPMAIPVRSKAADRIPDVGERAPLVDTDTMDSVRGDVGMLDTRVPPAPQLHKDSFADVVGKKPVALLFATPQLCQSRVCGPVTDAMLQLKAKYGDKMTFIHQEVYRDNDPTKGLRPSLEAFDLPSEPWLFTVSADGTIASRMEGSIGLTDFERAIQAALK
jgi:hypothetical protein